MSLHHVNIDVYTEILFQISCDLMKTKTWVLVRCDILRKPYHQWVIVGIPSGVFVVGGIQHHNSYCIDVRTYLVLDISVLSIFWIKVIGKTTPET
jgi:hypothetical protein